MMGFLALGVSQATISCLNYVVLSVIANKLRDPVIQALDLRMYRAVYGSHVEYSGIFPLVSFRIGFTAFERAYIILFAEMAVVVFALVEDAARLRRYLIRMFACYLTGVAVFLAWPVAGPFLYYPESFRSGYEATTTFLWMRSSYVEFSATRNHLQPITGFGYFVGVPSLHTAMALLCQLSLRRSKMLFWIFLPINILIIASTVVLGYHYVLDVPAGVALVAIVLKLTGARLPVRPAAAATVSVT
jgi:membrane-associated phospholipid phosphatase